ncbi:hypothetical protein [Streptomyces sp. NPDC050738]|uniref:hypothetical protein n=1 Tax=Streptomyces sp. NPDC050738 TaxID=3154744 RepID=UPI00343EE22D
MSWAFAPGASAGGPTSVLIVSPESARTTSFYYTDKDYETLTELLAAPGSGGQSTRPPSLGEAMAARQINVTWMIHDISPWRLDQVYARPESGTVWIRSSTDAPDFASGTWHRAAQAHELKALLKKLGMMEPPSDRGAGPVPPPDQTSGATTVVPTEPEQQPTPAAAAAGSASGTGSVSRAGDSTDWWWAIPGLVVGAGLALGLRPMSVRLLSRPRGGPRQELRDV